MSDVDRINISFTPEYINRVNIDGRVDTSNAEDIQNKIAIAQKFASHINAITEWNNRKDSIAFMIENAKKFASGYYIETQDEEVLESILAITGSPSNIIDMKLFEECLDIVVSGMDQHALVALTGVKNK